MSKKTIKTSAKVTKKDPVQAVKKVARTSRPVKQSVAPLKETVDAQVEKNEAHVWNVPPIAQTLKKPQVLIPVVALVILALCAYTFRSWFVVATVNGQIISRLQLDQQLEQQYGKEVLDSVITKTLVLQEAQNQHISVSQQEIDDSVKQISDTLSKQGQSLDSVLASRGMTKADLVDQIRLQKIIEKLVGKNVTVSDQEVADYISKNQDSLPTGLSGDQLKQQVKQQLLSQKINDKAQTLVTDLQKKAHITYVASF